MTMLVQLADGSPGLLFLKPTTRVVRLGGGVTYAEAKKLLGAQITDGDTDAIKWARTVTRMDGTEDVAAVFEVRR